MPIDLDELERLEKAATPAPWLEHEGDICVKVAPHVTTYRDGSHGTTYPGPETVLGGSPVGYENSSLMCSDMDRELVVAARNALPVLLTELRAARERIAELEHRERAAYCEGFDAHVRQCEAFGLFGAEVTGGRTEGEP